MSPRSCLPELAVSVMLVGCATGWAQEPSRMPRLEPGWAQKAQANAGIICEPMSEIYLQHVNQLPTPSDARARAELRAIKLAYLTGLMHGSMLLVPGIIEECSWIGFELARIELEIAQD